MVTWNKIFDTLLIVCKHSCSVLTCYLFHSHIYLITQNFLLLYRLYKKYVITISSKCLWTTQVTLIPIFPLCQAIFTWKNISKSSLKDFFGNPNSSHISSNKMYLNFLSWSGVLALTDFNCRRLRINSRYRHYNLFSF